MKSDDNYTSDDNTTSQLFSSQTELSNEADEEEKRYHRRKLTDSPRVIDSLALCYLGTLLLRIPVSIGYIQRFLAGVSGLAVNSSRLIVWLHFEGGFLETRFPS